jgi:hypothetical protein
LKDVDMPRFHVRNTFQITGDPNLFVMAGSILEGEIKTGMFVHIPSNSSLNTTVQIHSISFARRIGGSEDVCLCVKSDPELSDLLRALNIGDETFEITP